MRLLPNHLSVEIKERMPVAFVQIGSKISLIDAHGVVMGMPADRKEKYSDYEMIQHDYNMSHLWVVDVNGGEAKRLTQGHQFTVGAFSWSPDRCCQRLHRRRAIRDSVDTPMFQVPGQGRRSWKRGNCADDLPAHRALCGCL